MDVNATPHIAKDTINVPNVDLDTPNTRSNTLSQVSPSNPIYTSNDEYGNVANKTSKLASQKVIVLPSSLPNTQIVGEILKQGGEIAKGLQPSIVVGFKFVMPNGSSFLAADLVKVSNPASMKSHTAFTLTQTKKGKFHVITADQLSSLGYGKPLYAANKLGNMKGFKAAANNPFIKKHAKGLSNQINKSANGNIISFANVRENTDAQLSINTGFLYPFSARPKKPSKQQVNKLVNNVLETKMAGVNKAIRAASNVDDAITVLAVALSAGTGTPLAVAKKIVKEKMKKGLMREVLNKIKPSLKTIIRDQLESGKIKAVPLIGVAWKIDVTPVSKKQQQYIQSITHDKNFGNAGEGAKILTDLAKEAALKEVKMVENKVKNVKKRIYEISNTVNDVVQTVNKAGEIINSIKDTYDKVNNPRPQY